MSSAATLIFLITSLLVAPELSNSLVTNFARIGEWRLLTVGNFSSEINGCPRALVLLFNPWSGEARSLMRKISDLVMGNKSALDLLELFYVHKNKEITLTETIVGEVDDRTMVKVIYYHNSQPYWYRGPLVAKSILFSVFPYVAGRMEHWDGIPTTRLETKDQVDDFLGYTDKALILIETCGWTQNLLEAAGSFGKSVEKEEKLQFQGEFSEVEGNSEYNARTTKDEKQKKNNLHSVCAKEFGFNGIPWFVQEHVMREMSFLNDHSWNLGCPLTEFEKFEVFFSSFMFTARNFFFPHFKQKFGIVTEDSLLPYFGMEDSRSWHAMLYVNGCPACSQYFKEDDDIISFLQNAKSIVTELEDDMLTFFPTVPASNPSIILFVDRSSKSEDIRLKSNEAIDIIRKLALHYKLSSENSQQSDEQPERYKSKPVHPRAKLLFPTKEEFSVLLLDQERKTIINDVISHPIGNSFQELSYRVLQGKDPTKLSSLAMEAGFHLLSEDVNIKLQSAEAYSAPKSEDASMVKPRFDRNSFSRTSSDPYLQVQTFNGSFFFCDGNYQLLGSLTNDTKMPSLVLIDPTKNKHFVFPTESSITFSSVEEFINDHLHMRLSPFNKRSNQARVPYPSHADSLPEITYNNLLKFISDFSSGRLKQDILLLLTNQWCGFCQRMHLVVHEVSKAIQTHSNSQQFDHGIPKIFEMDCTLNDCNAILQALEMREVFPSVILFSLKNEKVLLYEGNMAVIDVLKFIAKNSYSLRGISEVENLRDNHKLFEVILNDRTRFAMESDMVENRRTTVVKVVVGTVLLATEKIETQPFENSMVVIVKADESGFEGLIYNKPISWDSINEFESEYSHLKDSTLFFGGPLMRVGQPLVSLTRVSGSQKVEVGGGVYFLDQSETMNLIKETKASGGDVSDLWLFFGFSRWDSGQLFYEIAVGAWNVSDWRPNFQLPL